MVIAKPQYQGVRSNVGHAFQVARGNFTSVGLSSEEPTYCNVNDVDLFDRVSAIPPLMLDFDPLF